MALVQEVVEFEAEDEALEFVLCGGVEEGHALVLVGGNLAAHMVIVQGEVKGGDGEDVDGTAVGEGGRGVALFGIARARPPVVDVVPQFEPGDGGDGSVAMQGVAVRAGVDDGGPLLTSPHRGGNCLFATAEAVATVGPELGEERGDVLRDGSGETGGAAAGVAEQGGAAHIDAADRLRRERVLLAFAVAGREAQREVLHGQLPLPVARRVPRVGLADDARRGAHRAVVHLHRLRQQRHHVADGSRVARRERQFAVGREGVVNAHRGIEHGLGVVQFIIVQPLQRCPDACTQVEAAVLGMNLEAGVEGRREGPAANVIHLASRRAIGFQVIVHCGHADGQVQPERLADGDLERRADIHAERRGLRCLPVVRTVLAERQP